MRVERRADGAVELYGYVNAVERDSEVLHSPRGPFVERVAAGTFSRALERAEDVELTFNHNRHLGSRNAGTVELAEDSIGLRAKAVVTDKEIAEKAEAGELTGWSFTFRRRENGDTWETIEEGLERRTLTDIDLMEVSVLSVTPAYRATTVELRDGSAAHEMRTMDDSQTAALPPVEKETDEHTGTDEKAAAQLAAMKQKIEIARRR